MAQTVEDLLGPEQTVDDLLGREIPLGTEVKLNPYDAARLQTGGQPMGPMGPIDADAGLGALGQVVGALAEVPGKVATAVADIPTRLHNLGLDPESPDYVPTLAERSKAGPIFQFPRIRLSPETQAALESSPIPLANAVPTAAGAFNVVSEMGESMLGRPETALTLPFMLGEGTLARMMQAGFGAAQLAALPEQVQEAVRVLQDPKSTRSDQVEALGRPGVSAVVGAGMLRAAAEALPRAGAEGPEPGSWSWAPEAVRRLQEGWEWLKGEGVTAENAKNAETGEREKAGEGVTAENAENAKTGEEPKAGVGRAVQTSERLPKPTVPEGPTEEERLIAEIMAPEPKPAKEIQTWDDAVQALRERGQGNETRADIQNLFPELGLKSEIAGKLAREAFGDQWRPGGAVPQPGPKVAEVTEQPKGVEHAKQNIEAAQPHGDVLNPSGPSEGAGALPAAEGGAGVPPRGQGETLRPPAQGTPEADVRGVTPSGVAMAPGGAEAAEAGVVHRMATGGAAASGATLRTAPPAVTRPAPVRVPAPSPVPRPAPGAIEALRSHLTAWRQGFQSVFSPQNIDATAKQFANVLRHYNAQEAVDLTRADAHLGELRGYFDKTPVPKDWAYDPAQPLPHNYAVMDALERNRSALEPRLQDWARAMDREFAWRIAEVRRLKPGAMEQLITNYFPHMWENPDSGAVRSWASEVAARSPLHGSKAFMQQRTLPLTVDGLARGLRPISDNPVDLALAKLHQMDKFLKAAKVMEEAKANGTLKYYPLGRRIPAGRTVVDDPAFTVYAPPVLSVPEAYDAGLRKGLMDFIGKMGFRHERVAKLGVNQWGQYTTGTGEIKSRFGGPDFVIMHEIGHGLEERYGLSRFLFANDTLRQEMSNLAALRTQGMSASKRMRTYVQSPDEQVANAVHAYLYAPEAMERVAPNAQKVLANIIRANPELEDLNDIKPGLAVGQSNTELKLPGPVLAGRWTLPNGAAQVLSNYLSPGLQKWAAFRTLRAGSHILNGAQLGMSAFHAGFTSLDAVVSSVATGLGYLLQGDLPKAARSAVFSTVAPVANYYLGKAVQGKMVDPTMTSVPVLDFPRLGIKGFQFQFSPAREAALRQIADLAVKGGLRAEMDPFWKTRITRNLVRAVNEGGLANYAKAGLGLPFAAVEQAMRPIAEYLVPRQKLGVFAQLARQEMDRMGPGASLDQVRAGMARAADATEDRMGQMTYDNLFYNKMVKDLALLGFRAYGWQLGKYRHLLGAAGDAGALVRNATEKLAAAAAGRPSTTPPLQITNRMLYPIALAMVAGGAGALTQMILAGKRPETLQDYMFPQNGQTDADGRPQRLMLPTYMKDLASDWKDFPDLQKMGASFYHKLNPGIAAAVDMYRNQDYYGVNIRNPDDPATKQAGELAAFVAKQFVPFSISGTARLADEKSPVAQLVLPFFGIVPAKKALTMTPAENLAAEIARAGMPIGGRTTEAFEHGRLVRQLAQDMRRDPAAGAQAFTANIGKLRPGDEKTVQSMLTMTPLQYQVHKMPASDAMRVWRVANPQEKALLGEQLQMKVANARSLDPERQSAYMLELAKGVRK